MKIGIAVAAVSAAMLLTGAGPAFAAEASQPTDGGSQPQSCNTGAPPREPGVSVVTPSGNSNNNCTEGSNRLGGATVTSCDEGSGEQQRVLTPSETTHFRNC
jgi:hypothetical protein